MREHGPKVPMIIYGPGIVATQGEVDDLASLAHIAPTGAELTGASLPGDYEFDGKSPQGGRGGTPEGRAVQ